MAWVSQALDNFDPGNARSVMLNRVSLCSALFLADDPDQALAVGTQLLPAATNMSSRRVIERVVNLRRDIPRDCRRSDIADFDRTLSTLGAAG